MYTEHQECVWKINAPNSKSEETPCIHLRISDSSYGFPIQKKPQNINLLEDHPNTFLPSLVLVVQMVSEKKIKMSKFTDEMRRRTQSDDNSSLDLNVTWSMI